jgi:hypothetical protein
MQQGSTLLLSLSLNNTTQLSHQIQAKPQIQVSNLIFLAMGYIIVIIFN